MPRQVVGYTVVQHSAYGYKNDLRFKQGLQPASLESVKQMHLVRSAGGVTFDTYKEADDFCDKAMYPPGVSGLNPQARGTFAQVTVDQLKVYVPIRQVVG